MWVGSRATIKALASRPAGTGGGRPVSISDPAGFHSGKKDLDPLLDRLQNKLQGDANQFTSETHQISYPVSRLTGDALEQIRGTYSTYTTVKELTDTLQAAFGHPDPRGTSQRQLAALRQCNQAFSRYLADFTRLPNHLTMTAESKIFTLQAGLSPALKVEIRFRDESSDLPDFISLLKSQTSR